MKSPAILNICKACGRDLVNARCAVCDAEVVAPAELRPSERIYQCIKRHPGLEAFEIGELLGDTSAQGMVNLSTSLSRLCRLGALRADSSSGARAYFAADESKLPRRPKRQDEGFKFGRGKRHGPRQKNAPRTADSIRGSRWYEKMKAEGRCPGCRAVKDPEWGRNVYCPTCTEEKRERHRWYRERNRKREAKKRRERTMRQKEVWQSTGTCRWCDEPANPGRTRCTACTKIAAEQDRERRQAFRDQGLCACGANADPGRKSCASCREKWRNLKRRAA